MVVVWLGIGWEIVKKEESAMSFYFLPEDYEGLNREIECIVRRIKLIGRDMGESCQQGAETYHDNFAYEEGERQQAMWSRRLQEFLRVKEKAQVVTPDKKFEKVSLGSQITISDEETGEQKTFRVGSYLVFQDQKCVSYNAPLAQQLMGASKGDICECDIAGKKRVFEIVEIH